MTTRRLRLAAGSAIAALALLVAGAGPAAAHPLGNFTVNTYSGLRIEPDRVVVDLVVDMAEIPALQARRAVDSDGDDRVGDAEATPYAGRACAEAAVDLARAARIARPTVFADDTLGWALRQAGRPAEALPYAQAAVRLGTADALLWYHLAVIEADLGRVDDARVHLSGALSINPHLTVRDLPAARALAARLGLAA